MATATISSKALPVSAMDGGTTLCCADCHAGTPNNKNPILNKHAESVACQACHIPIFARALPGQAGLRLGQY